MFNRTPGKNKLSHSRRQQATQDSAIASQESHEEILGDVLESSGIPRLGATAVPIFYQDTVPVDQEQASALVRDETLDMDSRLNAQTARIPHMEGAIENMFRELMDRIQSKATEAQNRGHSTV